MTPIDTALSALAERLCTAAGTDLDTTIRDLLGKHHSPDPAPLPPS